MKILLTAINAKYIHSNLAIYSLKKYAEKYKEQIQLAEYTINNRVDSILQDIYKQKPDVIALSCYIWNIDMIKELLPELKKVLPDTKIWLGGPEVSYETEGLLKAQPWIDGVMIGEGEETFLELAEHYIEGKLLLEDIAGIAYPSDTREIIVTPKRKPLVLSDIPFPYNDLKEFQNKIIYYETSRGCPYFCSYCLSSIERGVRLRDMDLVKKELQTFLDYKIPQVKFIDRTFNCNHKHAMEIWHYIKEHDNGITNFHFEISADLFIQEELELLNSMRVGLVQLEIGVQSTNPVTIKAINRKMDFKELSKAVRRIEEGKNIHQHLDLIVGLPFEDYKSFQKSFNDVYDLKPEQLQMGFLKVLKGSQMHVERKEHRILYKNTAPYEVLSTKWISYEDVLELKKVEDMVEVYYNSNQFTYTMKYLLHFYETPFQMYKSLGDYYEIKGFNGLSHSRNARYEILLQYVIEQKPKCAEILKEVLVYDLYLRENVKSRPFYAKDYEEDKEKYRKFYMEEEENRRHLKGYEEYNGRQMARMTHLEHFTMNIIKTVENGVKTGEEQYILFDYHHRNPLNYEAKTQLFSRDMELISH